MPRPHDCNQMPDNQPPLLICVNHIAAAIADVPAHFAHDQLYRYFVRNEYRHTLTKLNRLCISLTTIFTNINRRSIDPRIIRPPDKPCVPFPHFPTRGLERGVRGRCSRLQGAARRSHSTQRRMQGKGSHARGVLVSFHRRFDYNYLLHPLIFVC